MTPPQDFFLVSDDYFPNFGGVAELTHHLAAGLHARGLLAGLITGRPRTRAQDFELLAGPDWETRTPAPGGMVSRLRRHLAWRLHRRRFRQWTDSAGQRIATAGARAGALLMETWSPFSRRVFELASPSEARLGLFLHGAEIIGHRSDPVFLRMLERADFLVFNSHATAALLSEQVGRRFEVPAIVHHPGADFAHLAALPATPPALWPPTSADEIILSSVCRHVARKGLDLAIEALALLASDATLPPWKFCIAGTGGETERLQALAAVKLPGKVVFLGPCSEPEKRFVLEQSDLFLMPNHTCGGTDFEGFGISLIEAAFYHSLVIAGKSGGAVEAIENGVSGFLIDMERKDSVATLAARIREMLQNPTLRKATAAVAHRQVLEKFEPSRAMDELARRLKAALAAPVRAIP